MKTSAREEANDFVIKLFDKMQKMNLVGEMVFQKEYSSIRWIISGYKIDISQE